ncbi:uncharacterized protein LOC141856687 [Brevipalpus obovatus]|uniref:uncharacterized protein LOC141856687 n=1 Tax=Brevipalpus obovatus TaxID=246614 RepID=UPI003D9F2FFB
MKLYNVILVLSTFVIKLTLQSESEKIYEISKHRAHEVRERIGDLFWNYVGKNDLRKLQISSQCYQNLKSVTSKVNEKWVKQLQSLSGQFPKNFDLGTVGDFGDYDQCYGSKLPIKTRYCMAYLLPGDELLEVEKNVTKQDSFYRTEFSPEMSLYLSIGMCVPKSCSSDDIDTIFDHALNHSSKWIQGRKCRCDEENFQLQNLTNLQTVSLLFTIILVLLVSWAGSEDIRRMISGSKSSVPSRLYTCFSPKNNLAELFSSSNELRWRRIDQLRLLSYQIVLWMHIVFWPILSGPSMMDRTQPAKESCKNILVQPFINTYYFEGLICLGGLSSTITIRGKTNKNTPLIAFFKMIAMRFISTLPIIIATIFLEVSVSLFYKGPGLLAFRQIPTEACEESFLYHVLLIKSIKGKAIMCSPHFWSISAEFHLYALACLLMYFYHHNPTFAKIFMSLLSIGGLAYTVSVFYRLNLTPSFFVHPYKLKDGYYYTVGHYITTATHIWMFVYGVLLVVLLAERVDQKISHKWMRIFIQTSKLLLVICSFSSVIFNSYGVEITPFSSALYIAIVYSTYAFFVIWCIFSSGDEARVVIFSKNPEETPNSSDKNGKSALDNNANNQKSVQNNSSQELDLLQVLLKLSRVAYFPSTMVILAFYSSVREPFDGLTSKQISNYFVMYLCIYAAAPIFHILVTGPSAKFLQIIKGGQKKDHEKHE